MNFNALDVTESQVKSLVQLALELERYEVALLLAKEGTEGYDFADIPRKQKENKVKDKKREVHPQAAASAGSPRLHRHYH